jgi:hypothetical protein
MSVDLVKSKGTGKGQKRRTPPTGGNCEWFQGAMSSVHHDILHASSTVLSRKATGKFSGQPF